MANNTTTSLANFAQIHYRQHYGNDVPKAMGAVASNIKSKSAKETAGGKNLDATWMQKSYQGVGAGALTQNGDFPQPLQMGALNYTLALTAAAYAVGISDDAEVAMGQGPGFGWLKKKYAKEIYADLVDYAASIRGRFLMNDGTPIFATVSAVSGGALGYVTISSGSIRMFRKGEVVGIYDATSAGTNQLTGAGTPGLIVDIDEQNNRLYLTDVTGAAANDYVALSGFYNATVPNGLRNLVGSNTGTVQGVLRTTAGNFLAQPNVINFASVSLGATTMDQIRDLVEDVSSDREGKRKSRWAVTRTTRRWAQLATTGQVRFAAPTNLSLGTPSVDVNDVNGATTLDEDKYLRDGEVFVYDASKFVQIAPQDGMDGYPVMNGDSLYFQSTAASGAGYSASKVWYWVDRWNLGCDDFRKQGYGYGLLSP